MKKVQFNFEIRQAMQVATAVAEEVLNNTVYGNDFDTIPGDGIRPVLLSVAGPTHSELGNPERTVSATTFRFEGGVVVTINMIDMDQFTESWRTSHTQNFVVTSASIRFYALDPESCSRIADTKEEQTWSAEKLAALNIRRSWWHPHVTGLTDITSEIGCFWDNASADGFVEVDPEYNQSGHYTMFDTVSYCPFIEGDLERAKQEAEAKLTE